VNDTRTPTPDQSPALARDPILVDEVEAARLCSVSRPTFRNWVANGLVPKLALPGDIRRNLYRTEDLERFVASLADRAAAARAQA